jgi:hypothetical protein
MESYPFKVNMAASTLASVLAGILCLVITSCYGQNIWEFEYTGQEQTIELPAGSYKLEVWGAQGGEGHPDAPGGKGGYSVGEITFSNPNSIKVFVGESGESTGEGTYNGGGAAASNYGAEGGGATDIRIYPFALENRIIVAGGGGGGTYGSFPASGGAGGGDTGGMGLSADGFIGGQGGAQTMGGEAGCCYNNTSAGSFGEGAGPGSYHNAGGGGGWYGGGSGAAHAGAGGGSGYVGSLIENQMLSGNELLPDPANTESFIGGKEGNGFARITQKYRLNGLEVNDASCPETSNGLIRAEFIGGLAPYSFQWSHGETYNGTNNINEIANLSPGEYTLTATDATGIAISKSFSIGPDPLAVNIEMTQASSCEENTGGAAIATATGGTAPYDFVWSSGEESASISDKAAGTYTIIITDNNGCEPVEETVEIRPEDDIPPVAEAKNLTVYLNHDGVVVISPEEIDNGSTDNCLLSEISLSRTAFDCEDANQESITIALTATDAAGNSSQSEAELTVTDTISPIANAQNIIVELDENGFVSIHAEEINFGSSDNCAISEMSISKSSFSCEDLGINPILFEVVDVHGNTNTVSAEVEVIDNLAPTITGPEIIFICAKEAADYTDFSVSDNCKVNLQVVYGPKEGDILNEGVHVVEFQAQDSYGNIATFSSVISVYPRPVVDLGEDLQAAPGDLINLVAGQNEDYTYIWSTGQTTPSISFILQSEINISVDVYSTEGCRSSDQISADVSNTLLINEVKPENGVKLFPNPTTGQLSANLSLNQQDTDLSISIFDISGKTLVRTYFAAVKNGQTLNLDLSYMADGIYMINVKADGFSLTERIVKQ